MPDGDVKKIKGYKDLFRLRVGDYRVIFTINDKDLIIIVLTIGNRGEIYKKL
ncbi:MAG: type II toxin-antitoxin system RelE/ParE family toxin [Tepidanaerobacteraceae bacterium]